MDPREAFPDTLCGSDPNVKFMILGANLGGSTNSQSAVIKMEYYTYSILLPGDFETEKAQQDLVDCYKGTNELKAFIYKMAHHGASNLANDAPFVAAIQPQIAFTSQAYPETRNAHPRCDAINVLIDNGNIMRVNPQTNSPFACGAAANEPRVYNEWDRAIYATCREPRECSNIVIDMYPNRPPSVEYSGTYDLIK